MVRRLCSVSVAVALGVLAGCGGDDDESPERVTVPTGVPPAQVERLEDRVETLEREVGRLRRAARAADQADAAPTPDPADERTDDGASQDENVPQPDPESEPPEDCVEVAGVIC